MSWCQITMETRAEMSNSNRPPSRKQDALAVTNVSFGQGVLASRKLCRAIANLLGEPTFPKPMMVTVPMVTPKPKTGEAITKKWHFQYCCHMKSFPMFTTTIQLCSAHCTLGKAMGKRLHTFWKNSGALWRPVVIQGYCSIP